MEVLDLFYFEECLSIVDLQFDSARFSLEVSAAVGAFGRILLDERNDSRVSIETDVQTHYVAELQKTVEQVQGPHVLDYEVVWEFVVDSDLVKCNHFVHILSLILGRTMMLRRRTMTSDFKRMSTSLSSVNSHSIMSFNLSF